MGAGLLHLQGHLNTPAGTIPVRKGQLAAGVVICCARRNRSMGYSAVGRRTSKHGVRTRHAGRPRPVVGGANTRTLAAGLTVGGGSAHFVRHLSNVTQDSRDSVFSGVNNLVSVIGGAKPTTVERARRRHPRQVQHGRPLRDHGRAATRCVTPFNCLAQRRTRCRMEPA